MYCAVTVRPHVNCIARLFINSAIKRRTNSELNSGVMECSLPRAGGAGLRSMCVLGQVVGYRV